jgi:type I restriction enzyme, S subunit
VLLQRILERRRRSGQNVKECRPAASGTAGMPPELPKGWCWTTAETLYWDGGYGTSQKCSYDGAGPAVLRIPNVQNQALQLSDLKFATHPRQLRPEGVLRPGDFIFIRTNGSRDLIGRGALVDHPLPGEYHFASYLIRLRLVVVGALPQWFALFWHSRTAREQILRDAVSSAGQHNVSLSAAARYLVPLPPDAEQARIVAEVERRLSVLDTLDKTVDESLTRCDRLRQSILKRAFEGKLVPQDPRDEPASELLARIRARRIAGASA